MKWHCVAEPSKYCDGTQDWEIEPTQYRLVDGTPTYQTGGTCKLSPETCGRCKTLQQLWDELPQEEKDRISNPTYIQTVIPIEKLKVESKKPKSQKVKKLEAEIAQESMF